MDLSTARLCFQKRHKVTIPVSICQTPDLHSSLRFTRHDCLRFLPLYNRYPLLTHLSLYQFFNVLYFSSICSPLLTCRPVYLSPLSFPTKPDKSTNLQKNYPPIHEQIPPSLTPAKNKLKAKYLTRKKQVHHLDTYG